MYPVTIFCDFSGGTCNSDLGTGLTSCGEPEVFLHHWLSVADASYMPGTAFGLCCETPISAFRPDLSEEMLPTVLKLTTINGFVCRSFLPAMKLTYPKPAMAIFVRDFRDRPGRKLVTDRSLFQYRPCHIFPPPAAVLFHPHREQSPEDLL